MRQTLRIPRQRIPLLAESTRHEIENRAKVAIRINRDGDVEITGEVEGLLTAVDVVKAIGRGFTPGKALMLVQEENRLQVISLEGETDKTIRRLLSRVIGTGGKAKKQIERLTGTAVCVYGKTISIIGEAGAAERAAGAVNDLLAGRKHSYVYSKLEKMNRLSSGE